MKHLLLAALIGFANPYVMAQDYSITQEEDADLKVKITSPTRHQEFTVGETVDVTVEVTPETQGTTVASVQIFLNKDQVCEVTAAPYTCPVTIVAGKNKLKARATDSTGATASSGTIMVHGK